MERRFIITCLFLFCSFIIVRADWFPITQNYYRSVYRSGSQNWDMIQTPNGWVYFANEYGLLEFDGVNWITYPVNNGSAVRSLLFFENKIYAGAENEFGYYEPATTGHLSYKSLLNLVNKEDRSKIGNVWKIHQMGNDLYFQGDNVVFKYSDGKCVKIEVGKKIEYSTISDNVLWIIMQETGQDARQSISRFAENKLTDWVEPTMRNKKIVAMLPGNTNEIYYVTEVDGIFVKTGNKIEPFKTEIDDWMKSNRIFCAASNEKQIAVGSVEDGLSLLDYSGKMITRLNLQSGLSNNTILSANFDRDKNLWLGLDNGINYVVLNFPVTNLYGYYGKGTASALKGNMLYLGTNRGFFYVDNIQKLTANGFSLEKVAGCEGGRVWSLDVIRNDVFCSHSTGLYVVSEQDVHRAYKIDNIGLTWGCRLFRDDPSQVLVGTEEGFAVLKKVQNHWTFLHRIKGYKEPAVIFEEDGRYIWKGNRDQGIIRLTLNEKKDSVVNIVSYTTKNGLPTDLYNGIAKIDNEIFFLTYQGVYSYEKATDSMVQNRDFQQILGENKDISVSKLLKKGNNYWLISESLPGVFFFNNEIGQYDWDLKSGQYFKDILIPGFEHINPISDSIAVIGTENGFSMFNIARRMAHYRPTVSLRKVVLTQGRDSTVYEGSYTSQGIGLTIPYRYNSIRFEFSATDFLVNSGMMYSYCLENYDEVFCNFTSNYSKEYTGLPEGKYTLKVRARSNYWDEPSELSFSFEVLPPWYRSIYAYCAYFGLFLILIYVLFLLLKKELDHRKHKMEKQKREEIKAREEFFLKQQEEQEKEMMRLKNKKLEAELKMKSNELANSIMNIVEKNEIFNLINNGLSKIIAEQKDEKDDAISKKLRHLQIKIRQNVAQDEHWKKVESNFDVVYEDFFKKLIEIYPDLSKTERKFCALLRMNLSSKEIAQLTNITPRSVEIARYRIRKKMNLDRNDSLIDLLQKL